MPQQQRCIMYLDDEPVPSLLPLEPAKPGDLLQLLAEVLPHDKLMVLMQEGGGGMKATERAK